MSAPIRCAATCSVSNVEFRTSKAGTQFLSLTARRLGDDDDGEQLWITVWSRSKSQDLVDRLKPNCALYVEGTVWIKRWERDGIAQSALSISADIAEVLYDIEARPKAKKKETERPLAHARTAEKKVQTHTSGPTTTGTEKPNGSTSREVSRDGDAVIASSSETSVAASYCAGPAPSLKVPPHERPFDDPIPF